MSASIQISGLDVLQRKIEKLGSVAKRDLVEEIHAFCIDIQRTAKSLAPADEGNLRNQIQVNKDERGGEVVVNAKYAPFMEFGTKQFAARYVASLPPDWQQLASNFKGGGGSFDELLKNITEWVRRKGIEADLYFIALIIARRGVEQRPYLYPAFKQHEREFIRRLQNLLKA